MSDEYILYDPAEFNKIEIKSVENSDEITRLRADLAAVTEERDRMRGALKPFVELGLIEAKTKGLWGPRAIITMYVHYTDISNARAALEGVTEPVALWQHKKTGGVYEIVGECQIKATNAPGVLYRNTSTGVTWVRPKEEFFDGRFEKVTPIPPANTQTGERQCGYAR